MSALGIGSGLDANSLVTQLMAVEKQPLKLLDQQEAGYQAKLTTLGTVKSAIASFQSAALALSSASAVAYSASSSDSSVLTATSATGAVVGSYSIAVTNLAQPQKLIAAGQASTTAAIGTGAATTLTFTLGTISGGSLSSGTYTDATFTADGTKTPVTVAIGSTNNTLGGIRDAINAANAGVTASIVNDGSGTPYRLVLTSSSTGAAHSVRVEVAGDGSIASLLAYDANSNTGQKLSQTQLAQNAQLTVDGVNVTSATNAVTGAIQGVTLNLAAKTVSGPITVSVQRNTSALSSAVSSLVYAYNSAHSTISGATGKGDVLQGDWGVLSGENQMRSILGSALNPGGTYTNLMQLGVAFQKDGTLILDSSKLNAALAANPADAGALASAIGNALSSAADNILGTNGTIANAVDGLNRSITDIGNRRSNMQQRLTALQEQYQQQFSALDMLVSSMNQTSTYLTQQLASLSQLANYNISSSNKG